MKGLFGVALLLGGMVITPCFAQDGVYGEVIKAIADLDAQIAGLTQVVQGLQTSRDRLQSGLNGVYSATASYSWYFGVWSCAELTRSPDAVKGAIDDIFKVADLKCQSAGNQNCTRAEFVCRDIQDGQRLRAVFTAFVRASATPASAQPPR